MHCSRKKTAGVGGSFVRVRHERVEPQVKRRAPPRRLVLGEESRPMYDEQHPGYVFHQFTDNTVTYVDASGNEYVVAGRDGATLKAWVRTTQNNTQLTHASRKALAAAGVDVDRGESVGPEATVALYPLAGGPPVRALVAAWMFLPYYKSGEAHLHLFL